MYPLGFLFELEFDTATEVVVLGLAAGVATHEVPFPGMIAIPLLFAAGMSLIDTADGALMERFDRVTSFTGEQPCGGQVGVVAAECVEASGS